MPRAIGSVGDVLRKQAGEIVYYFGTITSDKLKSVTFVPVIEASAKTFLEEDTADGYQRPGSPGRMRAFRKFLEQNPTHVVPPILLSGRDGWEFTPRAGSSVGKLTINAPAAIIDGQHRAGGYVALHEANNEDVREVPFILLPSLSRDQELDAFLTVNTTQKGVPKALSEFLGDSDEAQVAWCLNIQNDSPFYGRISRTKQAKTQLFMLNSVAKEVKRLFSVGPLSDLNVEEKSEMAARFFTKVADILPDQWSDIEKLDDAESKGKLDFEYKLLELTGLIAWSHVGSVILSRSYNEAVGMNWDNVERLMQLACAIDWRKDGQFVGRTGTVGGKVMADEMMRLLPAEGTAA